MPQLERINIYLSIYLSPSHHIDAHHQVTSMQSQHLGLPYSASVPHLPPLKPGFSLTYSIYF